MTRPICEKFTKKGCKSLWKVARYAVNKEEKGEATQDIEV